MLLLMQNGTEIMRVGVGSRITLPNGDVVSPAMAGWSNGDYSLQPAPAPETPPPPTPEQLLAAERAAMVCSRFQAKAALHLAGLLPQVETAIAGADELTQLAWSEAVEYRRTSPTILALAAALELTDEQVDDLFRTAMTIEA